MIQNSSPLANRNDDQVEVFEEEYAQPPALSIASNPKLGFDMSVLFFLNGATLALPTTALMYIINTRASIPLVYLSVYGAIAFLPSSLKPIYAYLSDYVGQRHHLIACLIVLSGLSIASTALVQEGGIIWCFLAAFLREVFWAWPEFLLGVTLLEQAQEHADFDTVGALFQSQAATARNLGSLSANVVGFFFFLVQYLFMEQGSGLGDFSVNLILVATGSLNLFGGMYAAWYRVGSQCSTYTQLATHASIPVHNEEAAITRTMQGTACSDVSLVVLLQILVVLFALRGPLKDLTSTSFWNTIFSILIMGLILIFLVRRIQGKWYRHHRVGLFLMTRHCVPSASYIMSSIVYSLFQSTPMLLQLMGVISSFITAVSSWSYGRILAPRCSGTAFLAVFVGTTVAAALLSVLNVVVVHLEDDRTWTNFVIVALIGNVTTFSKEWSFLPSVVLATTASNVQTNTTGDAPQEDIETPTSSDQPHSYQKMHISCCETKSRSHSTGVLYATLVSCIDFGDQVGSWLTVPLVAALGVNREDWSNMGVFIVVTAILQLIPLVLLPSIRTDCK